MNCPRPRGNELLLCSISYNIMPCITTIYKSICALSGPNLASSINSAAATNNYPVYYQQQTRKRSRGSARKGFRRNFFARNARVIKETMLHHSYLPLYSLSTASPFAVEGQKNSQIQIDAKTKLNKMWHRGRVAVRYVRDRNRSRECIVVLFFVPFPLLSQINSVDIQLVIIF